MSDFLRELFNLDGKTVVVTGAAGYFGRYMAETFLEAGCRLVLLSRSSTVMTHCSDYRRRYGNERAEAHVVDFYSRQELDTVCRDVAAGSPPDAVVNNAFDFSPRTGFNTPGGRLESLGFEQWERAFESGLYWAVRTTQIFGEAMRRKGGGSIVNVASMYGIVSPRPDLYEGTRYFNPPTYTVVKAGLIAFTRYVAAFWGHDGIRCNALLPGAFPNVESASDNAVDPANDFLSRLADRTVLKRVGHPRDLRGALLLLASDAGSYITGQGIVVDGGWTVS